MDWSNIMKSGMTNQMKRGEKSCLSLFILKTNIHIWHFYQRILLESSAGCNGCLSWYSHSCIHPCICNRCCVHYFPFLTRNISSDS